MMLLCVTWLQHMFFFFFFNDTATTEIYTLSLHDALPISEDVNRRSVSVDHRIAGIWFRIRCTVVSFSSIACFVDRKSTRLNSSHSQISYAVFCLKKKKETQIGSRVDTTAVISAFSLLQLP